MPRGKQRASPAKQKATPRKGTSNETAPRRAQGRTLSIAAITEHGDLIVDPAAETFIALPWLKKFIQHGDGIAVCRAYTSSDWWHEWIPHVIRYARVEAAFVCIHGIAADDVKAFRSRFGALQRGGMLGAAAMPGKGQRLWYTPNLLHRAVFALELSQVGITPAVILSLINDLWDSRLRPIFADAETEVMHPTKGGDVVLLLGGISLVSGGERAVPNIQATTVGRLSARMDLPLSGDNKLPPRVLAINLTAQLRKFHDALAEEHLRPDQEARPKRPKKKR